MAEVNVVLPLVFRIPEFRIAKLIDVVFKCLVEVILGTCQTENKL